MCLRLAINRLYCVQGSTRHIFVFHDDPKVIVEWYMAIRSVKLTLLLVAYPTMSDTEVKLNVH